MKIVIIGGTGLIGSQVVARLRERGHEAVPAAPNTGVDTITGEGLDRVLPGAAVVVDVSNSPSFEDAAVLKFFQTSTTNLLAAEAEAGVAHHVALSVVGCDRVPGSGYLRAKVAQEKLIGGSSIPHSIVRATQFFEFVKPIADSATVGSTVRIPPVLVQPMAAADVAAAVFRCALVPPTNGVVEVGGPQQFRFDEFVRRGLGAYHDARDVVADPHARYYGAELNERDLVPGDDARLGETRFDEWLTRAVEHRESAPSQRPAPDRSAAAPGSPG